ncbi:hypothetical protein TIFTF001_007264 [Ficus carica]|uniref:Uncharacterized protein n=1 Tax=Ficus carica TaxID=3494 RepID=A0AA88A636_FICCA|nr:hypothetical protein TIFTF001_007264 [Ficus carica]
MEARKVKKVPGCSLAELDSVLEFFVGDDSHPETREIHMMLGKIMKNEEGKELSLALLEDES